MPIYGFRCVSDPLHTEEHYYPLRETDFARECETCGAAMQRDLRVEARNHVPASAFPYVTKHINGKPIEVRSAVHLQELCKLHGVRLRDDAEYVDEQLLGVENRPTFDSSGRMRLDTRPQYGGGRGGGSGCRWV